MVMRLKINLSFFEMRQGWYKNVWSQREFSAYSRRTWLESSSAVKTPQQYNYGRRIAEVILVDDRNLHQKLV